MNARRAHSASSGKSLTISAWSSGALLQRIGLVPRDAAAEEDAGAVGRGAIVVDHFSRVADRAVGREKPVDSLARKRLGCDDVAADRNDAAAEPWRDAAGIAVGADDHVASKNLATRSDDAKSAAPTFDRSDGAMRDDGRAGFDDAVEQAAMQESGVDGRVAGIDHAAVIDVGAELLRLFGARNQTSLTVDSGWRVGNDLARAPRIASRCARHGNAR